MKSIQRQLTSRVLAVVSGIAIIAGAFLYLYARSSLTDEFDRTLNTREKLVAGMVTQDEHGKLEFSASDTEISEFQPVHRPAYFEIWRQDGGVIARSPSLNDRDLPRPPAAGRVAPADLRLPNGRAGRAAAMQFNPRIDPDDLPAGANATPESSTGSPTLTLVVAEDRHELDEALGVLATSLGLAALAMAVGTAVGVTLSVRHSLRPLNQLARQADSIGAGSLDRHFPTSDVPQELKPICLGLNNLLLRLARAFARERRFTADAAHELRTPIAELRSLAEVALKWPGDAPHDQNYRDALNVARHMESLVTTLLAIARYEAGTPPIRLSPTDLAAVVREASAPHELAALSRQVAIEWRIQENIRVDSDRTLLAPLIGNLISNAVTYTPAGGTIHCMLTAPNGRAELTISNPCSDLSPQDLPHLFEPFWRKDPVRGGTAHAGLGLALVAAYARALGITVTPSLNAEGIFAVAVNLAGTGARRGAPIFKKMLEHEDDGNAQTLSHSRE